MDTRLIPVNNDTIYRLNALTSTDHLPACNSNSFLGQDLTSSTLVIETT